MQLKQLLFVLPNTEEKAIISKDVQVDADKLENGIKLLKEWLKCEAHLPNDVDELLIRNFLYGCKGNLETAKTKFERYMVTRTNVTQVYAGREVKNEIIQLWDIRRFMYVSSKLTPQGYRVVIMRIPSPDSTHFDSTELYKRMLLLFDLHLFNDENAGYEFVYDAKNFTMAMLGKVNLTLTHHCMQMVYDILPFRLKAIHLVNTTQALDIILNITMKTLPKKLKDRVLPRKIEELIHYLPKDCLPNEYGGTAGEFDVLIDRYNNFLVENSKWIKDTEELKLTGPIPEHKKGRYTFEEFSMDGSFRKLNFD